MFPSECVLDCRVRQDDDEFFAATNLQHFILECKDRKAEGYEDDKVETYNELVKVVDIGLRLAESPPAISYLSIQGAQMTGCIVALDKNVIIIMISFRGGLSHLIYDAAASSLRWIPLPPPSWNYIITSSVSIARPRQGDAYALVHTGRLAGVDQANSVCVWRPSSSSRSRRPWSEYKKFSFRSLVVAITDQEFCFNGQAYWVDLLRGVSYCSCDALFSGGDNRRGELEFRFLHLPVDEGHPDLPQRRAQTLAYRNMGVASDSIRFVSIDSFMDPRVEPKDRKVTVWKLLGHDDQDDHPWAEEHEFTMETLWGFEGFGEDVPKDLMPMFPLLSTTKDDSHGVVLYLVLCECFQKLHSMKYTRIDPRYLIAVDLHKKMVTSAPLGHSVHRTFFCCDVGGLRLSPRPASP